MCTNYIFLKCEEIYIKLVTEIFKMVLPKIIILTGLEILPLKKVKALVEKRENFKKFCLFIISYIFLFPLAFCDNIHNEIPVVPQTVKP